MMKRTAVHEAGHAICGRVLGLECGDVVITPDGDGGFTWVAGCRMIHNEFIASGGYRDFLSSVFLKLQVCLAGPEAERIAFGSADDAGDMRQIGELCRRYNISVLTVERLRPQVRALLLKHWDKIERVATALLDKKTLAGAEIDALFVGPVA